MPTAIIGAVGAIGGALISSHGQKKAANAAAGAAADSNALQKYVFDTQRADQAPWLDAGKNALARLGQASTPGGDLSFLTSQPGYQFGLNQGIGAITQSKAANGLLNSGSTLKALDAFGQGFAGSQFGDYWNRQAGLAGVGQTAVNQLGQAGQNYASRVGQNTMQAGNAQASAYANNGQAWQNALGGVAGTANTYLANKQPWYSGPQWTPQAGEDFGSLGGVF